MPAGRTRCCMWVGCVWVTGGYDSGKTLEVSHPVGLALDADSAVALALEDVRSSCADVCVRAALLKQRHLDGSHHDRVNGWGEHWHWHHSTSDDRSVHTHKHTRTHACFLFKHIVTKLHRTTVRQLVGNKQTLNYYLFQLPLMVTYSYNPSLCSCHGVAATKTGHLKWWIMTLLHTWYNNIAVTVQRFK